MNFSPQWRARKTAGVFGLSIALSALSGAHAQQTPREIMRFAAEMAKDSNWREARFRWEQAHAQHPDNYRILNNLGVAWEALGDPTKARTAYLEALSQKRSRVVETNLERCNRSWRVEEPTGEDATGNPERGDAAKPGKSPGAGKPIKVVVELPVPARLDLDGARTLLVVSFLTNESTLLDINRELVRFLRSEYRKRTTLEVLEVTPPPAVPEQTLEDLIANSEFWKYLGREYGADLIVSGVSTFDRRDHSGFRDVDTIHPTTGQKIRNSEFVEQEQFEYEMDLIFMDGASGALRFRDRITRAAVFQGTQNDPITAFFELSDSLAPDILAIVKPRTRQGTRVIFRK